MKSCHSRIRYWNGGQVRFWDGRLQLMRDLGRMTCKGQVQAWCAGHKVRMRQLSSGSIPRTANSWWG